MDGSIMTPAEIETAARRMLNAEGDDFWSQAEIIENYLYLCLQEMAGSIDCIQNRYVTTSVASQQEYAVPGRMVKIKRVEYDSQKLQPITFQQLDAIDVNTNTTVTGTPQYYYYWDDVFGLYPAPDTASVEIKIYSLDDPSPPTSVSTLEVPVQFHGYLVIGVAYYMSLKELGHPHTTRLEAQWLQSIERARTTWKMRNRDNFHVVTREEDLPQTVWGAI
jgi:hypothetical protein